MVPPTRLTEPVPTPAAPVRSRPARSWTRRPQERPAALAAARVSRAGLILGSSGLASCVFVIWRLVESWRVTPGASAHHVTVLGQRLGYPTANLDAVVVLVLAGLGLAVTATAVIAAGREVAAARRFARRMARARPRRRGGALVFDDPCPEAFCAGLLRPRVYVSSGAVGLLDAPALRAVLAHERHHARRYDPLRAAVGRVLARSVFFLPWLGDLARQQEALAELGADESAVAAHPAGRAGLARAMLSFSDSGLGGIDPARVDYVLGGAPTWRFPAAVCGAAVVAIGLILAVAGLAGAVAAGSATLAPPFLSGQPCVVALALIPAAVGLLAAARRRSAGWEVPGRAAAVPAPGIATRRHT